MKNWSDKNLCFECAKEVNANINIGHQFKGRCQRCHSLQTLFRVREAPPAPQESSDNICKECAHPAGTHAESCSLSEISQLRKERESIIQALEETVGFDRDRPLSDQIRRVLQKTEQAEPR